MANNHIQRINDDIQFHLSALLRSVKDPRVNQGGLLSIVRTDTTGDLRYCRVYLSVLGEYSEKELKKGLKSCSPWLRRELGQSMSLRYTPELIFEIDHSIEQGAHISALIESLDIHHDTEEEAEED
ncbi:MAG: 30S ribosome-binding factor RbfA [Clostridiales bacterium]|nr:30S ribosome-binding factor RbfA [Candidatus Apopatocola equi]MCQ2439997.1 30S ribosome-binding factor RbfA [Oscillospiraceae bacterium]